MTASAQHGFGSGDHGGPLGRSAITRLRNVAGRVYYSFSRKLDSKPEELIAAAFIDARRRGRAPICVAAPFPLRISDIEGLTREPALNGIVGENGPDELRLWQQSIPHAMLGTYWESGRWMLPPGVVHVYLIGSWRRLTLAMLREAIRRQAVSLTVRCARGWIDVPLDSVRRIARLSRPAGANRAKATDPPAEPGPEPRVAKPVVRGNQAVRRRSAGGHRHRAAARSTRSAERRAGARSPRRR